MKKYLKKLLISTEDIFENLKQTYKKNRRFMYKVKGTFTIKNLCKRFEVEVPDKLKPIQNVRHGYVTWDDADIEEGCVFFAQYGYNATEEWYKKIMKKKPAVIFIPKNYYESYVPKGDYPVIPVPDLFEKQGELIASIGKRNRAKRLAITGSIGKTTTKQLLNCILSKEGMTFCHLGNLNTYRSVSENTLYKVNKLIKYYIQEVAAFSPHAVERSAQMLRPDAYILTNIYPHHLNTYKTKENVLIDKASLSKYINKGGVAVVNYDDDLIANYDFGHQIITFGINTKRKVDYRGVNIVQNNEFLELDVEHDGKIVTHLKVNVVGKHNAYNILGVYALCKWLGIKDDHIRKNILNFKTTGIRQNIVNVGGMHLYLDCYNVAFEALSADLKTLEDMKVDKGAKKIAIIAPENKLGENYKEKMYEFGKTLKGLKVDHVICYTVSDKNFELSEDYYGLNSKSMYQGMKDAGMKNIYDIDTPEDLEKKIKELCKPGDVILIKTNWELLVTAAFDKLFGSTITIDFLRNNKDIVERYVKDKTFSYYLNEMFNEVEITKYKGEQKHLKHLIIPDKDPEGHKVFSLRNSLFRYNKYIENIDFGKSLRNIGSLAFANCKNIKTLNIPSNVKYIGRSAFANCTNLTTVNIEEGLVHMRKTAFLNCPKLKDIYLPKSLSYIEDNPFGKNKKITIHCHKNSYAYKYAKDNNLKYEIIK